MKRPIPTKCDHDVLSDECSLQPYIRPIRKIGEPDDGKPKAYCPVCKKDFN